MAFRHRQHLIFKYLQLIFEGTDGKEKVSAVTTYILGVAERSEEEFLKQIQDTTFTIKPEVMSTLEQILERGRKEGLEKGIEKGIEKGMDRGVYKNSIFNLLKTAVHFPDWPAKKLAERGGRHHFPVCQIAGGFGSTEQVRPSGSACQYPTERGR